MRRRNGPRVDYSVAELARLGGMSRKRMHRLLDASEIPKVRVGNKDIVLLSSLHSRAGSLIDSIDLVQAFRDAEKKK